MPQKLKPANPLIAKLNHQSKQIELLRHKVFVLQEALIRNSGLSVCDLNHPLSSIIPIERRFFSNVNKTVIVFGGMLTRLGMPPAEFLKTFIDKKINVLFIKDFKQCWYQQGLLGISDNIEMTIDAIKTHLPSNQKNIYTVGTSSGGFAAILFGALMNVDKAIAFGPQTKITEEVYEKFKSIDSRKDEIDLTNKFFDLGQLLEETKYAGQIYLHYAADNEKDKEAAAHIAHLKCVHTYAHPTDNHNIARWLKKKDILNSVLEEFLD
ncbi:MAG: hypothetical protein ACU837_04265 [Gammaproteobacteria bacterium]